MKKIGKKIGIVVAVLATLLVIVLGVLYTNRNTIVRKSIETVLSEVLQVKVTLESVNVSISNSTVEIKGLVIGNPEGFNTPKAFSMDSILVKVDLLSFKTEEPVINIISMEGPDITIEQGFRGSNISALIKNASGEEKKKSEEKKESESGKAIKIEKVVVEKAEVDLSAPVLKGRSVSFTLPRFEMNDIGGKGEKTTIAESIRIFLTEILKRALTQGKGIIPDDLQESLQSSLDSVVSSVGQQMGSISDITKDVGEGLQKGLDDATEGIKDLLGK